jgi:hypothetical protein
VFLNLFDDSNKSKNDESNDIDDSSKFLSNKVIYDNNDMLQIILNDINKTLLIKENSLRN